MIQEIEMVKEFNRAFRIETQKKFEAPQREVYQLRYELLREELEEFLQACEEGNKWAIADALTDISYVLAGTYIACGIEPEVAINLFREVHRSNMTKLDSEGNPVIRYDGKIMKGSNYEPPRIKDVINKFGHGEQFKRNEENV